MLLTLEVSDSTRSDHASDPRVDPTRFMPTPLNRFGSRCERIARSALINRGLNASINAKFIARKADVRHTPAAAASCLAGSDAVFPRVHETTDPPDVD